MIQNFKCSLIVIKMLTFPGVNLEVTGNLRTLNSEELYEFYSPNIIPMIKSGRMRWAWHVARMVEIRGAYRVLVRRPKGRRPLGRHDIDGRVILKWIFKT